MAASRAIKAERDRLTQQVAELTNLRTTETTDLHSQLASVEERLLAAESERLRYQRSADAKRLAAEHALQALQAEHDGLLLRMGAMESNATEVDNLLQALRRERDDLVAQKQDLAQQLEAGQAALIDERAAALAERDQKLTTLRQAQEAAQKTWQLTGTALDARVAKLSSESDLRRAVHNAVQRLEQERLQHASEIEALIEDSAAQAASADSGLPASDHGEVTAFPVIAEEDGEREHEKPLIIERSAPLPEEIGRLIG